LRYKIKEFKFANDPNDAGRIPVKCLLSHAKYCIPVNELKDDGIVPVYADMIPFKYFLKELDSNNNFVVSVYE
jgi:hypothetical protein